MTPAIPPRAPRSRLPNLLAHRVRSPIALAAMNLAAGLVMLVVFTALIAAVILRTTRHFAPWWSLGICCGLVAGLALAAAAARAYERRILRAWAESGWPSTIHPSWPWDEGAHAIHGEVSVQFTRECTVRGFPVAVVQAAWRRNGLGSVAPSYNGSGVLVVVRLPRAYEATAIHRRRNQIRRPEPFDRKFHLTCADPRLEAGVSGAELRQSHVDGLVPPWIINSNELYAYVSSASIPPSPQQAAQYIIRTLRVVDLLHIV